MNMKMKGVWGLVATGTVLVGVAGWGVWQLVTLVPVDVARVWGLVATGLVPVAGWAGWRLGHLEAQGRLKGIDQAIGQVMGAASRTADLRGYTARAVRREKRPAVVLPDVEIVERLGDGGSGGVVEL